jgi:hypothetical protein
MLISCLAVEEMTAKEVAGTAKAIQMESIASTARAKDILQETIQVRAHRYAY